MFRSHLTATALGVATAFCLAFATPAAANFGEGDIRSIQAFTKRLLERAKTGSSTTWRNGDGSIGGRVTITTTDAQPGAQPCRTYEWTMRRQGGQEMTGIGRGCRTSSGDWTLDETRSERQSSVKPSPAPAKVYPPKSASGPSSTAGATRSIQPPKTEKTEKSVEAAPDEASADATASAPPTPAEQLATLEFTRPPRTLGPITQDQSSVSAPGAEDAIEAGDPIEPDDTSAPIEAQ